MVGGVNIRICEEKGEEGGERKWKRGDVGEQVKEIGDDRKQLEWESGKKKVKKVREGRVFRKNYKFVFKRENVNNKMSLS